MARIGWLAIAALAGCTSSPSAGEGTAETGQASTNATAPTSSTDDASPSTSSTGSPVGSSDGDTSSDTGTSDDTTGADVQPTEWTPDVLDQQLLCKLISDESTADPTANDTHHRANVQGTDLGIPLVIDGALHLFFGDTQGYRVIWAIGEDPDSVARVDAARVRADPRALCDGLEFLVTPDDPSVAAGVDPAIVRDFAAGTMTPPPGQALSDYIGQHPPPFPNIPGTFEVPTGAVRIGDAVYTFWAGQTTFDPRPQMNLSYVARWDPPRTLPDYQIVRPFDARTGGALGGHFIQVLPFVQDDEVYVLGTGDYRFGGVSLMRFPAAEIETGLGAEVFDPGTQTWLDAPATDPETLASLPTLFEDDGVGELGGVFVPEPGVFVVLYQRELHGPGGDIVDNRVVLRTAASPQGPWSDAVTVIDMADPDFTSQHCCGAGGCEGDQILNCFVAGLYGVYPLPEPNVIENADGTVELEIAFVASTWNPYNVVLFESRVRVSPGFGTGR